MLYKYIILFILFNSISLLSMEHASKEPLLKEHASKLSNEFLLKEHVSKSSKDIKLNVPQRKELESDTPRKTKNNPRNTPRQKEETTKEQRERHHKERLASQKKHFEEMKKLLEEQHTQSVMLSLILNQAQEIIIEKTHSDRRKQATLSDESSAQLWTILSKEQKEMYNRMMTSAYMVKNNYTIPVQTEKEDDSEDSGKEKKKERKKLKNFRPSSFYTKTK